MRTKSRFAVTLIEVLIVLAILLLALLPMLTLFSGQTKQASQAGHLLRAHSHLLQLIQQAESRLHISRFRMEDEDIGPNVKPVRWTKGTIDVTEMVSIRRSTMTSGLFEIRVNIKWNESRGMKMKPMSSTLVRLVADPSEDTK